LDKIIVEEFQDSLEFLDEEIAKSHREEKLLDALKFITDNTKPPRWHRTAVEERIQGGLIKTIEDTKLYLRFLSTISQEKYELMISSNPTAEQLKRQIEKQLDAARRIPAVSKVSVSKKR